MTRPAPANLLAFVIPFILPLWAAAAAPPPPSLERPVELDPYEVVTSATRTERLAADLPIRTERLAPELFRAAGTSDLGAALEYLPGARVEANCQNCGTAEVKLLGLGTGYNQLLFGSQPLFGGLAAVYGLEHVPTAFIDRVEVVKGGASTLYGPGAVAGVINIIPREPVTSQTILETRAESFAGSPALSGVAVVDWAGPRGKAAASLFGEARTADAVDLNDDGFTEITEKDFLTGGTHLWFYPTESARVSANYAHVREYRRGGNRLDLLPHEAQITEELDHRWHRGGLSWEQDLHSAFFMKIGLSASHIERDSYYGGVGEVALPGEPGHDPVAYAAAADDARLLYGYTESARLFLDNLFTWRTGPHTLSFGAQYQHDRIFDEKRDNAGRPLRTDGSPAARSGEDPIADGTFDNLGVFIQDEWDPTPEWTVIGGIRFDRHSELQDWTASPRAAVRHTIHPDLVLRASLSTGFRAPEVFDEDFHIEILDDPTRTRNAPDLREETTLSLAGGFVWTPSATDGRLQFDVEFYRTDLSDTFHVSDRRFSDGQGTFKLRENAGGSVVQGFEANILYRFTDALSLDAGINFTDARFDEPQEVLPGLHEERFLESPRWSGVSRLTYRNEEFVDLFLGLVWTGPMIAVNEVDGFVNHDTGHFFVVDFSVTRHIDLGREGEGGHLDITAGVRNLFDERQPDLTSGPGRDSTYFYGPRFPRSLFFTASLKF